MCLVQQESRHLILHMLRRWWPWLIRLSQWNHLVASQHLQHVVSEENHLFREVANTARIGRQNDIWNLLGNVCSHIISEWCLRQSLRSRILRTWNEDKTSTAFHMVRQMLHHQLQPFESFSVGFNPIGCWQERSRTKRSHENICRRRSRTFVALKYISQFLSISHAIQMNLAEYHIQAISIVNLGLLQNTELVVRVTSSEYLHWNLVSLLAQTPWNGFWNDNPLSMKAISGHSSFRKHEGAIGHQLVVPHTISVFVKLDGVSSVNVLNGPAPSLITIIGSTRQ
mmetsp:Transcript_94408/g.148550  ORF Transcript_94408/g.148550 Transcript_94408/m.148550 type:complete len:283 (+) Transcript_94408:324-1172(+)